MALRKENNSADLPSISMAPLSFPRKFIAKRNTVDTDRTAHADIEADVDIDLREVYFLIMHFLSAGPCKRTFGQFWNELLEHQLLPRRYHAWYSRNGERSGNEDDDGLSLPLCYFKLVERHPHIKQDHLVKLLKQLLTTSSQPHGMICGNSSNAADVPTLLGLGSFSLLGSTKDIEDKEKHRLPHYLRWPHIHANQVHGLSLREIGGGFTKHGRAPSIRAACYGIAKPSTMVEKMQIIKKVRGHQNAVYCAIFDRSGRYVITGSDDRLVKIWSMETAFCLASCRGHEGDITDLAVSSNNGLVASSSNDFSIRVWRLPDGLPISILRGHTAAVTAIVFSPRPGAMFQLLSSSDDGTCRIWDAIYSQSSPRIYIPKPPELVVGKEIDPSPSTTSQSHQILCCAFNANGTVFVTGSSDTFARVWNASKSNVENSEQPNNELDILSGHENDVNYVQFSACSVPSRSFGGDILKDDNVPKFKNTWFTHDNIVTCSRDGSAIIWTPRSRRSHGKVGRWTRAYHLKVPPPPMAPQPPRGGPRQRFQPTPRGVNMIVWSLDNRFVLAAIMDCRICVWNASDGSLVHSLMGHSESTFVLDVHPFNPRMAMSAGYDGRTIIWDIWEGTPVRIYETGRFKLVDGKFSPDGTSIILSDEVGQMHIIATGQGESQKDAQYDQFFLGDYRPLTHDAHGNVLDQETQLAPYRRNIQDLLCDSSMIPYPEPYQNMYQQLRLGTLGMEWRPPSVKFAVGPTYNVNSGDYQMLPLVDLDGWGADPLPEFVDVLDWEHEIELQSDDTDSEYNVTDECCSERGHGSLSGNSSADEEGSAEDVDADIDSKERLRRSKRKKMKSEVEFTTSGRRVKRRKVDDHDGAITRAQRNQKFKYSRKKSTTSKSRPQRRSARNALSFFSKMKEDSSDGECEDVSVGGTSESDSFPPDSNYQSNESERSPQTNQFMLDKVSEGHSRSVFEDLGKPSGLPEVPSNFGTRKRLVLKLPRRDSKVGASIINIQSECNEHGIVNQLEGANSSETRLLETNAVMHSSSELADNLVLQNNNGDITKEKEQGMSDLSVVSSGYQGNTIKWGEVKARTSKRLRVGNPLASSLCIPNIPANDPVFVGNVNYGHVKVEECDKSSHSVPSLDRKEHGNIAVLGRLYPECKSVPIQASLNANQQDLITTASACNGNGSGHLIHVDGEYGVNPDSAECKGSSENTDRSNGISVVRTPWNTHENSVNGGSVNEQGVRGRYPTLKIKKPQGLKMGAKLQSLSDDCKSSECELPLEQKTISTYEEDGSSTQQSPDNVECNSRSFQVPSTSRRFSAVYVRSKLSRSRTHVEGNSNEGSTSNQFDTLDDKLDSVRRTRSRGTKPIPRELNTDSALNNGGRSALNGCENLRYGDWKTSSNTTVGLRSTRNRRENFKFQEMRSVDNRKGRQNFGKPSWLMLLEHEESYRYIPQLGDEVAYLTQGYEEYMCRSRTQDTEVCSLVRGRLRAVEFCEVQGIDYAAVPGSGESCCKLTLVFTDPSSVAFGELFKLTLPELVSDADFLVEKTRYDASIARDWRFRDKCAVWWRHEVGDGGDWWEGRITVVKPKSPHFPDSPWERYAVRYKNESGAEHPHSPWELQDVDIRWEHPCIDDESRDKLLASIAKMEKPAIQKKDYYGVEKINTAARKSDFLNRFPVPLSLEVIKGRLENNYYRQLDAVKHDALVMLSNAKTHWRNEEMMAKLNRLAKWIDTTFDQ